jgi:hypothetical protein
MKSIRRDRVGFGGSMIRAFGRPVIGLGIAAMLFTGCDAATGEGAGEGEGTGGTEIVLGTLDLGYGTVSFRETTHDDNSVSIQMVEDIPNTFNNTPVQRLISEGHTSLEMWKSLMPDQAIPSSLLRAHPAEAAILKRPTSDVIAGIFDREAPIEKSASSCRALADAYVFKPVASTSCYDYAWVNKRYSAAASGTHFFHVISSGATTTSNVTMGICNDSNVDIKGRPMVKKADSSSYQPIWSAWAVVSPGYLHYWYNFSRMSTSDCSNVPPGQICLAVPLASAYRIDGASTEGKTYYMYTGVLQSTLKSACVPR